MKSNKKNNLIIGFSNNPRTSSLHGKQGKSEKGDWWKRRRRGGNKRENKRVKVESMEKKRYGREERRRKRKLEENKGNGK